MDAGEDSSQRSRESLTIGGIVLQDTTGGAQPTFYLDDISFINQGIPPPPPLTGPALSINVSAGRHAISRNIYGMNFADQTLAAALNLPVRRWGGNSTTRYNWQTNIHNAGSDWYFENIPDGDPVTDGSASDLFIDQDRSHRDQDTHDRAPHRLDPFRATVHGIKPYDCGFEVTKYGRQQSTDSYDTQLRERRVLSNGKTSRAIPLSIPAPRSDPLL